DQNTSLLILRRFGSACAIIVWLMAHELFIDKKKIPNIVWVLAAASIIFRAIWSYLTVATEIEWQIRALTVGVSQLIAIGFVFHALYIVVADYDTDLVVTRRGD